MSVQVMAQEQGSEPSETVENATMAIVATDDVSGEPPLVISAMSSSVNGQPAMLSFAAPAGDLMRLGNLASFGPPDPMGLLHNADIQKEIELDSDQLEEFKNVTAEFQQQMQDHTSALRDGKLERDKLMEMATKMKKLKDEQTSRLKQILVPHQLERLQQISTQQFLESAGTANALTSKHLADHLGLTKEQIERLKARSAEVNKKLQEKIASLKAEAREEILDELTSEQKEKIKLLMGKKYSYKLPELGEIRRSSQSRQQELEANH
jgi:hypothetical protein